MSDASHIRPRVASSAFATVGWRIVEMRGREAISEVFDFSLRVAVDRDAEFTSEEVLGAKLTLEFVDLDGHVQREVHGVVAEVHRDLSSDGADRRFVVRMVPRLWRAGLVSTQEIFVDRDVPSIVEKKLGRLRLGARTSLLESYPQREFVVQYGETDLAFVSRLTEHLGVSFIFDHSQGEDHVVFVDHPGAFPALDSSPLPCSSSWDERGVYRREPEYGGHVKNPAEGAALAKVRADRKSLEAETISGKSDIAGLEAGRAVELDHPEFAGQKLILVEVEHEAVYPETDDPTPLIPYRNRFVAMRTDVTYRPALKTPRPRIHGVLTGIIEPGTATGIGRHAEFDGEGRYTVKFTYDTAPFDQPKASHPVRRAQPLAGAGSLTR